jgi:hypothetical protein
MIYVEIQTTIWVIRSEQPCREVEGLLGSSTTQDVEAGRRFVLIFGPQTSRTCFLI